MEDNEEVRITDHL